VTFVDSARRTLFLAGWHVRLRLLRIRRERTLLVTVLAVFILVGARLLPKAIALSHKIHAWLVQLSPVEQATARGLFAALVWFVCIVAPSGHLVEPAAMRRYPFTAAQRIRARLLAQALDYEWLLVFVAVGFAPPLAVGLTIGIRGVFATAFAAIGLAALWLGSIAMRDAATASLRLGRRRMASTLVPLVLLVGLLSLATILVRNVLAVRDRTADVLTTLPPLWPPVWWARSVDAMIGGNTLTACFWLGCVLASAIAALTLAEFMHLRSQLDPVPRAAARHRSRVAERVPPGPVAAAFAKEWLALRRDPLARSAYAGAIVLPLLALGWMALGRESIVEWKAKAFWMLGIATAFALGSARGSSLALERAGVALLGQLPARFRKLGFGMDLVQWIVAAVTITSVLAAAGFILGPSVDWVAAWATSLVLTWGFLATQHLVARFFPFHVERAGGWFETPLVASLLNLLIGILVMLPTLVALGRYGAAASFAAALLMSPLAYWFGLQLLERSSPG